MEDLRSDEPVIKSRWDVLDFMERLIVLLFVVDESIEMVYFNERFYIWSVGF